MTRSPKTWKHRMACSLCAALASTGVAARGEDGPAIHPPGQLIVSGPAAPISPVAHVAGEDDPPPAPPLSFTPAEEAEPAPFEAAPSFADDIAPAPLADDAGAPGLRPPPLHGLEDVPEVTIAAPVPTEAPETELVQERFPNGSLKIAREVTQDGQGNFLNHGSWREWNQQGQLIAEGQYKRGVRYGVWRRVLGASESPLFSTSPYNQYKGPFVSEARLEEGQLSGMWTIADAQGRKISEIPFEDGLRHGVASWWHANGRKMQQITFDRGVVIEEILVWRNDGALAAKETYRDGRKLETKTEYYAANRRKSTGEFLSPKMVVTQGDDWWNCRLASFSPQGQPQRHGVWTAWHPNGQVQVDGRFEEGRPVGEFTWYYPNGQKSAEGAYRNGERHGVWTWWHENGLKSSMGDFVEGKPAGQWTWWNPDGKVAQKADFADGVPAHALQPQRPASQARLPASTRRQ